MQSSSLKFKLFEMPSQEEIVSGNIEQIGLEESKINIKKNGEKKVHHLVLKNHTEAVNILLKLLIEEKIVTTLNEIDAVGHRVVHGGEQFAESVIIDEKVEQVIENLSMLAPLHNPANLTGYRAFKKALPDVKQVAVLIQHSIKPCQLKVIYILFLMNIMKSLRLDAMVSMELHIYMYQTVRLNY